MRYVALLRAVNLLGHNRVDMARLRDFVTDLGFTGVRSLLQSGNLVFDGARRSTAGLEKLLEGAARERLDVDTDFVVRTAAEWRGIVSGNPFPRDAERDPSHLLVMVLNGEPRSGGIAAVRAWIAERGGGERIAAVGRHAYVAYPEGIAQSRLRSAVIEPRLGVRGTMRNWNTVLKLGALCGVGSS